VAAPLTGARPSRDGEPVPLLPLRLPPAAPALPRDVRLFLREADRRSAQFLRTRCLPGFVPSDYIKAYAALRAAARIGPPFAL
jgi:hypothetical protein